MGRLDGGTSPGAALVVGAAGLEPPAPKPTPPATPVDGYRLRHDTIDADGKLTVRHAGRLHHVGIRRRHDHKTIAMLGGGREIRILDADTGEPIRQLTLDPTRDFQPQD